MLTIITEMGIKIYSINEMMFLPFLFTVTLHMLILILQVSLMNEVRVKGKVSTSTSHLDNHKMDVDIEKLSIVPAKVLSAPQEMALSLRWIALLSGEIEADFAAATGVHDGKSIIKQLLVGAKSVQLCSVLFQNGLDYIQTMLKVLDDWMARHNFGSLADFQGMLCQEESEHPEVYERAQNVKALVGIS